ncbi:MAG: aminoglycoside adenylyltransferase domain-containing protein [Candidatus Zixiibacteriota bacterium]
MMPGAPLLTVGEGKGRKMTIKEQVSAIGSAFVRGLRRILGNKLYGLYIYGAAAFPDDVPTGDIDFHVILTDPLTDDERSHLYELHDSLARDFPPLGVDMDGYYILLADAWFASPPQSQMWQRATDKSWALYRQHVRAGRVIVLHGPDPKEIYPPATWPEIEQALEEELKYVEDHLDQYPHYCILQLCRLIYSHETRKVVVSKAQASDWAGDAFPKWKRQIELARKSYARQATPEDREFMLTEIRAFLEFARTQIENARQRGHQQGGAEEADKPRR